MGIGKVLHTCKRNIKIEKMKKKRFSILREEILTNKT